MDHGLWANLEQDFAGQSLRIEAGWNNTQNLGTFAHFDAFSKIFIIPYVPLFGRTQIGYAMVTLRCGAKICT
jgi:hypothetical protein